MRPKNYCVCSKCGTKIEASEAKSAGWLVATNVRKVGQMVIRCPRHITDYIQRQTRYTQAEIDAILDKDTEMRLYRIEDMEIGGKADRHIRALGFEPIENVVEVEETDGCYSTFQVWLTQEQVQALAENEAIYELIQD